jgi:hypothetical protein
MKWTECCSTGGRLRGVVESTMDGGGLTSGGGNKESGRPRYFGVSTGAGTGLFKWWNIRIYGRTLLYLKGLMGQWILPLIAS